MRRDHPRDVWVEVTTLGDATPRFLLAVDGVEAEIADARDRYVAGHMDAEEFERIVGRALAP